MDYFRKPTIESRHCNSSIEMRDVHDGVHFRSPSLQRMTQDPFNANRAVEALGFRVEDVLMSNVSHSFCSWRPLLV